MINCISYFHIKLYLVFHESTSELDVEFSITIFTIIGMLPSYEDATKGSVFLFNTIHSPQNTTQHGYQCARPAFTHTLQGDANDRPPQYIDIIDTP